MLHCPELDANLGPVHDLVVRPNVERIGKTLRTTNGDLLRKAFWMIRDPVINMWVCNADVLDGDDHIRLEEGECSVHVLT